MSFLHNVHLGFFGTDAEAQPERPLEFEECQRVLSEFIRVAPADLQIEVEPSPRGNMTRGIVLAYADGYPIVLKAGKLRCPYLTTYFILSSIAFAAFVHKSLGCSIYSYDDGRFLSLREFVPEKSFSEIMWEVARQTGQNPDPTENEVEQ